jgi:Cu(I)/Ag(I) efflux system membrane fusion protein
MTAGHNHGAAPATVAAKPVHLSDSDAQRIGITFAVAEVAPLEREVRAVAQVTFDETRVTAITPRVDGWVERLAVNTTGQTVRQGDPLFGLYSPMVLAAEQDLIVAQRLSRNVAGGTGDAIAGAEQLRASARQRLELWGVPQSEVDRVERTGVVERTVTFRSPVSGVVLEKLVVEGQRVMMGEPVYRIADISTIWIEGEVFERDLAGMTVGQTVTAEIQALPGQDRKGTISYISPVLDADTRTARVRVVLTNPGLRLKPGMYATLRISSAITPVLSIPRSAVLVTGARALAFLKRPDGAFEPREVVLGRANDDRVEVMHGLVAGDSVVASATFLVDAESNLGTIMGGMGNMPGMDIRPPDSPATPRKE